VDQNCLWQVKTSTLKKAKDREQFKACHESSIAPVTEMVLKKAGRGEGGGNREERIHGNRSLRLIQESRAAGETDGIRGKTRLGRRGEGAVGKKKGGTKGGEKKTPYLACGRERGGHSGMRNGLARSGRKDR